MFRNEEKSASGKEWLSCRDVLWCVAFCGFGLDYILRLSFSLAIVAMVLPRPEFVALAECTEYSNASSVWVNDSSLATANEQNVTDISVTSMDPENSTLINTAQYLDRFAWSEYEQGLALGAYYWLHWVAQIPGSLLTRRYGTKLIFGWANFAPALLGFLIPFFARQHLYAFIFLRVLQGMATGMAWPAMHNMTAKWIPPNERGKFISSYLGSSVGAALAYPLSAFLVNSFGWPSVFYVTSTMGVIWYIAWYFLAFDTPQEHPRISGFEKSHILESLGDSVNHGVSVAVPWKKILTSRPIWAIVLAEIGSFWGDITISSQAPTYLTFIHGWSISAAGVFSAAPHVARMIFSILFSTLADSMLRNNILSRTKLRKLATFICNGLQGVMLFCLALSGCRPVLAIVFMVLGMTAGGATSSGTIANSVDLSPNYASVIMGVGNTLTTHVGFISPIIVGILTNNDQTVEQWRLVFFIAFGVMFLSSCIYMLFASAELQPWNDRGNEEAGEELRKLHSNVDKVVLRETTPGMTGGTKGGFLAVSTEDPAQESNN